MNFKLRYFLESDFKNYQELTNDPKIARLAGMKILVNAFEQWMAFKGIVGRQGFLAIANEQDSVVGGIFLFEQSEKNHFDLGYLLEEKYWNTGVMSKAIYFAIKNLRNRLNEDGVVTANVNLNNYGSQRVLEKNGFERLPGVQKHASGFDGQIQQEFKYQLIIKKPLNI